MPWYLGKAGSMIQLPAPSRGSQTPYSLQGGTHNLLSGGRVRDNFGVKRSWQFSWQALTHAQVGILDAFVYGATGAGPWLLYDPEQRNLLSLNVSTATDTTLDTTGFTGFLSISSSTGANFDWNFLGGPFPALSTRTLATAIPNGTGANSDLFVTSVLTPVSPGLPFTASMYLDTTAASSVTVCTAFAWRDASGTYISTVYGNTISGGSAGRSVATGTAPSNAVYVGVGAQTVSGNSSGSTRSVYADGLQFEQGSAATAWMPGTGVPSVAIDGGGRVRQQADLNDYTLSLIEL